MVVNLLRSFGVQAAEEVAQNEQALHTTRQTIQGLLGVVAGVAPEGIEQLLSDLAEAEGEALRCKEALHTLPAPAEDAGEALPEETAAKLEAEAQKAFADAQAKHDAARVAAAAAQEQLRLAKDELAAAEARVADPNRAKVRADNQAALQEAKTTEENVVQQIGQLQLQLDQANPQLLSADIERFAKSADAQQLAHEQLSASLHQLGGQLRAQGALGLEEEAASVGEEVLRLERQVEDRRRRAEALTHLRDLLMTKRAEVARSIRAPLQKHINHYLGIQFPGMTIELDEKLRPHQVTRQGSHGTEIGTFDEMSGGEREQLGVIARFAYADLLKEKGKPTLLMLDDSFVNCDVDRLAVMKRVIYDAATRHQILIFTCHEENWRDMGVAPISVQ